jgi:uncharacterized heparinase superfamily protein
LFSERGTVDGGRIEKRPSHFLDAGLTLLRTAPGSLPEIWCRCDGGPHGFLSIAAHAHADALSVELRHGGVGILIDPGTYCYHGEPEFRRYFRSTLAHNTIELSSTDQSLSGGPFLWLRHARTKKVRVEWNGDGSVRRWSAEHDGYGALDPPATHRRSVGLDEDGRRIEIEDVVETAGSHAARLLFHLGPTVQCRLVENAAELTWLSDTGDGEWSATLELPGECSWSVRRGDTGPLIGWYSSSFGSIPYRRGVGCRGVGLRS